MLYERVGNFSYFCFEMHVTDEILLKAIENKDEKAFSRFYKRYSHTILCFVLSKVHNVETAKEVVQNFWLTFWENPGILRANKEGCVKVFLLQYLCFRILDIYRIAIPETIRVEETEATSTITADGNIEKEELINIVNDALQDSSMLTKKTFWKRIEKIPAKEVAEELNITTQTVHNNFSKSLETIKKYVKTNYPEIIKNRRIL
jgi:RNA polymerase sigma factor, sigma-70 family